MKLYATLLLVLGMTVANAQDNSGQEVIIHIENLKNNKGKIFAALYKDEAHFLKDGFKSEIVDIAERACTVTFKDVPQGVYAVSFFHDENDNGKMDTNFLGIPKEAYGCSNNAKGFMGPPKWEDAKFELTTKPIEQTIAL